MKSVNQRACVALSIINARWGQRRYIGATGRRGAPLQSLKRIFNEDFLIGVYVKVRVHVPRKFTTSVADELFVAERAEPRVATAMIVDSATLCSCSSHLWACFSPLRRSRKVGQPFQQPLEHRTRLGAEEPLRRRRPVRPPTQIVMHYG